MAITYTNNPATVYLYRRSWSGGQTGGGFVGQLYWHAGLAPGDWLMFSRNAKVTSTAGEGGLSGPFHNIYFDVAVPVIATGYTYVWEYYGTREGINGWYTIPNVTDNTNGLQNSGANSVDFIPPIDWYFYVDGSFTLASIRIRCTGLTSISTIGTQAGQTVKVGENRIRVTGTEDFDDIYDADVSGGWGVVTRTGFIEPELDVDSNYPDYFVYFVNAWLAVGNGTTATLLTKKYGHIESYRTIVIRNNATFEIGEDGGDGFGRFPTVNLAVWDVGCRRGHTITDAGGTFKSWGGVISIGSWWQSWGAVELKETNIICRFGGLQFYTDDTVMRRVTVTNARDGFRAYGNTSLEDVTIVSGIEGLWFGANDGVSDVVYNRLTVTEADTFELLPVGFSPGGYTLFLDDCNINDETSFNKYFSPEVTISFRHTWSALVRDTDGNPMQDVTIVCKNKDGDTEFSVTTGPSGTTGDQKIVRKTVHYAVGASGAIGNATVTDYNPFEFTFSKVGFNDSVLKNVTLAGGSTDVISWETVFGFP